MQKTIYECDHCKKTIGPVAHVTLVMSTNHHGTGVAVPPGTDLAIGKTGVWNTIKLKNNFIHLHFGCMEKYFKAVLDSMLKVVKPAKRHGKG